MRVAESMACLQGPWAHFPLCKPEEAERLHSPSKEWLFSAFRLMQMRRKQHDLEGRQWLTLAHSPFSSPACPGRGALSKGRAWTAKLVCPVLKTLEAWLCPWPHKGPGPQAESSQIPASPGSLAPLRLGH